MQTWLYVQVAESSSCPPTAHATPRRRFAPRHSRRRSPPRLEPALRQGERMRKLKKYGSEEQEDMSCKQGSEAEGEEEEEGWGQGAGAGGWGAHHMLFPHGPMQPDMGNMELMAMQHGMGLPLHPTGYMHGPGFMHGGGFLDPGAWQPGSATHRGEEGDEQLPMQAHMQGLHGFKELLPLLEGGVRVKDEPGSNRGGGEQPGSPALSVEQQRQEVQGHEGYQGHWEGAGAGEEMLWGHRRAFYRPHSLARWACHSLCHIFRLCVSGLGRLGH